MERSGQGSSRFRGTEGMVAGAWGRDGFVRGMAQEHPLTNLCRTSNQPVYVAREVVHNFKKRKEFTFTVQGWIDLDINVLP